MVKKLIRRLILWAFDDTKTRLTLIKEIDKELARLVKLNRSVLHEAIKQATSEGIIKEVDRLMKKAPHQKGERL